MVKSNDNLWKVCGLIDGFNELYRTIYSGVEKTADEPMSAMRFRSTPRGNLPHYFYIFRNLEPLGIEMKNVAFYRLGAMFHLEIQKGKEATKTSEFKKYIGVTSACMNIPSIATKGCGQLTPNDS